jgi:hypothetical protein
MTNGNAGHRHVWVVVAPAERTEGASLCEFCGMDDHAAPGSLLRSFERQLRRRAARSVPSASAWSAQVWPKDLLMAAANAESFDRAVADAELLRLDACDPMASQVGTGRSGRRSWTR